MTGTSVATQEDGWRTQLRKMDGEFGVALPAHITAERFRRAAETAIMKEPKLRDCDRRTLFQSLMQCAETGLMPDGKHAALVPYNGQVQFQPMVFGLLSLMRNSDEVKEIIVDVIREGDAYEVERGDNPRIVHKPDLLGDGPIIAAYAILTTKDGGRYAEIMNRKALDKVRNCSQSYRYAERKGKKDSVWHQWEDEMSIKSVVKRLSKRSPTSNDRLIRAVDYDNQDYRPELATVPIREKLPASKEMHALLKGEPVDDIDPEDNVSDVDAEDVAEENQSAPEAASQNEPQAADQPELLPDAAFVSAQDAMDDIAKHIKDCKTENTDDLMERYDGWKLLVDTSFREPKDIVMAGRKLVNQKRLEIERVTA